MESELLELELDAVEEKEDDGLELELELDIVEE